MNVVRVSTFILLAAFALDGCRSDREATGSEEVQTRKRRQDNGVDMNSGESMIRIRNHFSADASPCWSEDEMTAVLLSLQKADLMTIMEEISRLKPNGRDDGFLDKAMLKLVDLGATDDELFAWLQKSPVEEDLVRYLGSVMGKKIRKSFPKFIERFDNKRQRESLTLSYYSALAEQQPVQAIEAMLVPGGNKKAISENFAAVIRSMPADADFEKIAGLISASTSFPANGDRAQVLSWIVENWSGVHPSEAADFSWEGRDKSNYPLSQIIGVWAAEDPQPALDWVMRHEEISDRFDEAVSAFVGERAEYDPEQCENLAARIGDLERRRRCYEMVFKKWGECQPEEATAARAKWLEGQQ